MPRLRIILPVVYGCLLLLLTAGTSAIAQTAANDTPANSAQSSPGDAEDAEVLQQRLIYIQTVLDERESERQRLIAEPTSSNPQAAAEQQRALTTLSDNIRQLRSTLETIATGGADTSLFLPRAEQAESDWREDLTLIAQPVLDSLKDLTEKPRRLKELNDIIAQREQELEIATSALQELERSGTGNNNAALSATLNALQGTWNRRVNDARNGIEVARIQIAGLQGKQSMPTAVINALDAFVRGRGLTLLLAVVAAVTVWMVIRFLLRGYRRTLVDRQQAQSRMRYRLAAYSVRALTGILVLIAVFSVFYQRGDVLLLGLMILLLFGLALSIRHLLPRYVQEARLLLNIGAMREGERLLYNGLPWRVESINMFTVLRNPELHGALRIPLARLTDVHSRPVSSDSWFPTSTGDVVLLDGDVLLEVIEQNPDTVELRQRGGQIVSIPSADFYATRMVNLTRAGTFGVSASFGVDYNLQGISHTVVPQTIKAQVQAALNDSNLGEHVQEVRVELKQAGDSSIDYWIFVTLHSPAARSYLRLKRLIQGACIQTCTENGWSIPYPHLSVQGKPAGTEPVDPAIPKRAASG